MLQRLIRHAGHHVPYYRRLFRDIGFDCDTFESKEQLRDIPLLDKETLRTNPDDFVADNASSFQPNWARTGGSTGTPLTFMLSAESRANDAASILRAYNWAGFFPGQTVFTMKDYFAGWTLSTGMFGRSLDFDTNRLCKETGIEAWKRINVLKPRFFHGYPFSLLMLGIIAKEEGISYHIPKTIICIGESLSEELRQKLAEVYPGARIFDLYSMSENAVLISECPLGSMHVHEDLAYHEFVDEAGQAVASGRAAIVGTGYFNLAMPLIRYQTRDYAWLDKEKVPCSCGRLFRTIARIEGRQEDYIQTPEGLRVNLLERAMYPGQGIAASQYIQDALDHLYVNIIPGPDFEPESLNAVREALKQRLGSSMHIDFHIVEHLERRSQNSGKTPFLISRIGKKIYA
jgi:phenylacetate-CoA ligase